MNKSDHIRSLIPKYKNGDITLDEIQKTVGCSRVLLYQIIPISFQEKIIQNVNYKNFEKIKLIDASKIIVQSKSKTIGDWDNMTKKEREPYI